MTVLIPDTNAFVASPRLDSAAWSSLIDHRDDWGLKIVVPELVVIETVNVLRREWATLKDRVTALALGALKLGKQQAALVAAIDEHSTTYEARLRTRLTEIGADIAPIPTVEHLDIARRASEGRAPYGTKDKDGYRDTLIWHSVLAAAEQHPDAEIWFISENHNDFGPKPPNWTGENSGQRNDCPILFHADLIAELAGLGLTDRVHYVVNAHSLEQHIAARFAPIADIDLRELASALDQTQLASRLAEAVSGLPLQPRAAALPVHTVAAKALGARPPSQGWLFYDAAGRGELGWTARFAVTTDVDVLAVITASDDVDELTKPLTLSGDITVSPDGELLDLTVISGAALPDDPIRDRWTRLDERVNQTTQLAADIRSTYPNLVDYIQVPGLKAPANFAAFNIDTPATAALADLAKLQRPLFDFTPNLPKLDISSYVPKFDISSYVPKFDLGSVAGRFTFPSIGDWTRRKQQPSGDGQATDAQRRQRNGTETSSEEGGGE